MKYVCDLCGWEYDEEQGYPEGGIAPGTKWEDVPEDFECPLCSAGKFILNNENRWQNRQRTILSPVLRYEREEEKHVSGSK